jgi:presenilin-like A22 family membrane protease
MLKQRSCFWIVGNRFPHMEYPKDQGWLPSLQPHQVQTLNRYNYFLTSFFSFCFSLTSSHATKEDYISCSSKNVLEKVIFWSYILMVVLEKWSSCFSNIMACLLACFYYSSALSFAPVWFTNLKCQLSWVLSSSCGCLSWGTVAFREGIDLT